MHETKLQIRQLSSQDANAWKTIRLKMLETHPLAFMRTHEEAKAQPIEQLQERFENGPPDNVTFGAFGGTELIGTISIFRQTNVKQQHRAEIVALYVMPEYNGKGIAKKLVTKCLEHAKDTLKVEVIGLTVAGGNPAAEKLYESFGFKCWGTEPDAVREGSVSVDDKHYWLSLN